MTPTNLFSTLPADARCWFYVADHPLSTEEQSALLDALQLFFERWVSHGRPVQGEAAILDNRFLVVAATLAGDISGCGIDASVHAVEAAAQHAGISLLSPLLVFYRDLEGIVQHRSRAAFRSLVQEGEVTGETLVFDLSLTTLGQLRSGAFEKPAAQSWHARIFRMPASIS